MTRTPIPEDAHRYVQAIREEMFTRLGQTVKSAQSILDDEGINTYLASHGERIEKLNDSLRFWTLVKETMDKNRAIELLMNRSPFHHVPDNEEDRTNLRMLFIILYPLD